MVLPQWDASVTVDAVQPNMSGELDSDLRMQPWIENYDHLQIEPGDWESAVRTIQAERTLIDEADKASDSPADFEHHISTAQGGAEWYGLDLGVAGLVMALNAAGFATASSCRQHVGVLGFGEYPFVSATGDLERIAALTPLVQSAGAGMSQAAPGQGFGIYANTVRELMKLAELIVKARPAFDTIPETIGWNSTCEEYG